MQAKVFFFRCFYYSQGRFRCGRSADGDRVYFFGVFSLEVYWLSSASDITLLRLEISSILLVARLAPALRLLTGDPQNWLRLVRFVTRAELERRFPTSTWVFAGGSTRLRPTSSRDKTDDQ